MDTLKSPQKINCCSNCLCYKENAELDYQIDLPQYLDEAEKIIKCDPAVRVSATEVVDSELKVFGSVKFSITYVTKDGILLSYDASEEFTKTLSLKSKSDHCSVAVNAAVARSSHRMINRRKLDDHISVCFYIKVFTEENYDYITDCGDLIVKQDVVDAIEIISSDRTIVNFEDEFQLNIDPEYNNLISTFYSVSNSEIKIIKNKMLIKSKISLSVLLSDSKGSLMRTDQSIITSKIVDIDRCEEDDFAFVSSSASEVFVKLKTNSDNTYLLSVSGCINHEYVIMRQNEYSFISDLYSMTNEVESMQSEVEMLTGASRADDSVSVKMNIETEDNIVEIMDMANCLENPVIAQGEIRAVMATRILFYNDNSELRYFEAKNEIKITLANANAGLINLDVDSFDYVIKSSNSVEVKLNLNYQALLYVSGRFRIITDYQTGDACSPQPVLSIYFADAGEDIWSIAKKFKTQSGLIMEENNLTGDTIHSKTTLLIPSA